ncbi:hypothetical protein R1N_19490 [Enterobacter asburiae]|nr:hypothetical protein R1N_19490 [Enterobacter asburiae]
MSVLSKTGYYSATGDKIIFRFRDKSENKYGTNEINLIKNQDSGIVSAIAPGCPLSSLMRSECNDYYAR